MDGETTAPLEHRREPNAAASVPAPKVIGPYRILELIGEGGFGVVYLAEQTEPVRRRVALKVIKPGMDSKAVIARFEAERQALAVMDHPHVARVFDGGITDRGLPYFAMEYVKGEPITVFCDLHKLSLDSRIRLFIQVCEAVQHAHTKAIIHRDLKPSNILVAYDAEGRPSVRVIDFGVAKALNQRLSEHTIFTERGQLIGTLEYMSPEQAEMSGLDIDTRADVYSLGVILYELLTGLLPFDSQSLRVAAFTEIQRVIRESEPPKPSTRLGNAGESATVISGSRHTDARSLTNILRGELDWVVMKCLEKDRARRYDTPSALAAELRRYLAKEPVQARPPSASYRLRKFITRRRGPVVAAGAIALTLIAGAIASTVFAMRASRAEADAESRAAELEKVAAFQESQLSGIDTLQMGRHLRSSILSDVPEVQRAELASALATVNFTDVALEALDQDVFDRALKAIGTQFTDQPLVRARLLQATARTLRDLGLLDRATAPQQEALELFRRVSGDDDPATIQAMDAAALLLYYQGNYAEAEPIYSDALVRARRVLGDTALITLGIMSNYGLLLRESGDTEKAQPLLEQALLGYRRVLGDDDASTINAIINLGQLLKWDGKLEAAEPYYREAVDRASAALGENHKLTLTAINNLGSLMEAQGKLPDAERYYRTSLDRSREVLGEDHPDTLDTANNLGCLLTNVRKFDESEACLRDTVERSRSALGPDHPATIVYLNNLGFLYKVQGKPREAEPYFREAMEGTARTLGAEHPTTLRLAANLGAVLRMLERYTEALAILEEIEPGARIEFTGPSARVLASVLHNIGDCRTATGDFARAEPMLVEARAVYADSRGETHKDTLDATTSLIALYTAWHATEPGKGHDAKAGEWRAKLDAAKAATDTE